jgi:REP element-mobilizing transposase RayT
VVDGRVELGGRGRVALERWRALPAHHSGVLVDRLVVMPDHVHGILLLGQGAGRAPPLHLSTVIGSYKASVSRLIGEPLWQRGYHDRVIRSERELEELRRYIAENPVRWWLRYGPASRQV